MKRTMTFPEFERRCYDWFEENKSSHHLSDLRIWNTVPGNSLDRDLWYCIVNIRHGVNMIMLYDHSGELDAPFEVFCDRARKALNTPNSQDTGFTTSYGEYYAIEQALNEMLEEPTPYRISIIRDSYAVGRVLTKEEKVENLGRFVDLESLSFLECLEKLENWRKHPNSCKWTGRKMSIIHCDPMKEEIYITQL